MKAEKVVLIAYDAAAELGDADDLDVFDQALLVEENLARLGFRTERFPVSLDLGQAAARLHRSRPDLIFNLVESLDRKGALLHLAPALWESLDIGFSGCGSEAIYLTSHKLLAKNVFRLNGILTPEYRLLSEAGESFFDRDQTYLCKYVWEHASKGIGSETIFRGNERDKIARLTASRSAVSRLSFYERYVHGREFNVSLLAGRLLNIAEMVFVDYGEDQLRILDYEAKWNEESETYRKTVRSFEFASGDRALLEELERISLRIWRLFNLRGYARVDFRVSEDNRPWVLEVNANPCISRGAGFMAAAAAAGIPEQEVIATIIGDI